MAILEMFDVVQPIGADPELASTIQSLHAQAKAGEVQAVALVVVNADGTLTTLFKDNRQQEHRLIAGVATLQHRLIAESLSRAEPAFGEGP